MINKKNKAYKLLRYIYESSKYYKSKVIKMNEEIAQLNVELESKNSYLIDKYFGNGLKILSGPFKGMQYIRKSSGSTLFPKLIGSYEESIQNIIQKSILNNYEKIIDIGCAEGYYAVGFAYKCPNSKIIACDLDKQAIDNLKELIEINNVSNVEIRQEGFGFESLNKILEKAEKTLLICDIEGNEIDLLDLENVPNLRNVDMIIESHDCFISGLSEVLINRFYNTHVIEVIINYDFLLNNYPILEQLSDKIAKYMTNEQRPPQMKYLYLKSRFN